MIVNASKFRSSADMLTFKSAYSHLISEGSVDPSGYVKLSDLQSLIVGRKTEKPWEFRGNWKNVLPYYAA